MQLSRLRLPKVARAHAFVACEVGKVFYVLPVEQVQEITRPLALTPLPHGPVAIIGAVEHREQIVPILDLGAQMGFGETRSPTRKWVLVRGSGRVVGVVVDQVHEVFEISEDGLRAAPEVGDAVARAASHVLNYRGHMAFVLSLESVARLAEVALPMESDE